MSDDGVSDDSAKLTGEPVPMYAPALVFIGAWGFFLPPQHVQHGPPNPTRILGGFAHL